MPEKSTKQGGPAVIIAIVAIVVVVIAAVVFVVVGNDGDQPEEPQVVSPEPELVEPSLPGDAESPVDPALERLQVSISDPDLSWTEKADAWTDFLYETGPAPSECQQLPPGDSSFFAAIQPALERREYSPDIRVFLEEMVAIATEYDILDNEWNDTPEAVDRGAQLVLKHGAEISPNDDGVLLCLHHRPQSLQALPLERPKAPAWSTRPPFWGRPGSVDRVFGGGRKKGVLEERETRQRTAATRCRLKASPILGIW